MPVGKVSGLSRRQAFGVVTGLAGMLYGSMSYSQSAGRQMLLSLDEVSVIIVRYRGRDVAVPPAALLDALQGK